MNLKELILESLEEILAAQRFELDTFQTPSETLEQDPEENETYMIRQNLEMVIDYAQQMLVILDENPDADLEEWVEDKISTATDRIHSVAHYLLHGKRDK